MCREEGGLAGPGASGPEGSRAGVQAAAEGATASWCLREVGPVEQFCQALDKTPKCTQVLKKDQAPAGGDKACRLITTGATAARGCPGQVGRSKLLPPPPAWASPVPRGADPTRETLGRAAVWFAGSQAQQQ